MQGGNCFKELDCIQHINNTNEMLRIVVCAPRCPVETDTFEIESDNKFLTFERGARPGFRDMLYRDNDCNYGYL